MGEGRTEEEFVKQVLSVHLRDHGVSTTPIVVGSPGHKGGRVTVRRIAAHMQRLVQNFDAMKRQCPRFAAWLSRLESLGLGADES